MRYLEIPEISVVHGEKAVKALQDFISELETQEPKELTKKQIDALIKVAKGLISSIEAEEQSANACQQRKKTLFGFLTPSLWFSTLHKR